VAPESSLMQITTWKLKIGISHKRQFWESG
jgi:hypothetical protein